MLEVSDVSFSYGDAPPVLENLSLQFREREFTVILGPNGCGKTTLGLLLNGILKPTSGTVLMPDVKKEGNQLSESPNDP